MFCGCRSVDENDITRCKNPQLHFNNNQQDSAPESHALAPVLEQTSDVLGVGWTLSQLSSNRHYYQEDGGNEKQEEPNISQNKFNDFASTCRELRPNNAGDNNNSEGHAMTHEHNFHPPEVDLSDETIETVMYQQCVLQYHLMMYHFPAPLPEFYEMYTRHIERPYSELQEEFDLKLEHFILANYTFPPVEKRKEPESLLDQCNKFLDHCLQHR
ncbi:hypothetical protein C9374_014484 [Naegleria lovaniensis]|uniref:Uncharacterized protein n=1 Tax=Naegleria lovaniensis TaxID=51637 RepID=A0AA88H024_NAELO|nr:uncharacterized protein C9374_014484 [Naegleria lovaniensis]KAG2389084.1 hypothetical protein C9374_014484 [Naegleria lovaniensis]